MRYLFVSTFPPTHCGIAAYSMQSVNLLRQQGNIVDVISPDEAGNVDFAADLKGGWRVLRLLRLLFFYDRVVVQYSPNFFYHGVGDPAARIDSIRTSLAFILLFVVGRRRLEVLAHEVAYLEPNQELNFRLYRWKWKVVPRLVLHTAIERDKLFRHYKIEIPASRIELRTHHELFQRFSTLSRDQARQVLGLSASAVIFLCIGFIQRHKGFERAASAIQRSGITGAELYVVGSLRTADPDNYRYLSELVAVIHQSSTTQLVERFVDDQEFDTWITACDWVVLPYREIWSSSILARAKLLQRPAIISNVGGLSDQAGPGDLFFETDDDLEESFRLAMETMGAKATL